MANQNLQRISSHRFTGDTLLGISITTLMFSVSGFTFFELYANRLVVEIISLLFTLIFGCKYFLKGINKPLDYQALLVISFFLFMSFHLYDISYIADAIASIFIVILIGGADVKLTDKILKYLIEVTVVLCIIGLILFITAVIDPDLTYNISPESNLRHPLRFFGGILPGYEFGSLSIPRSQSFTYEPSFLPSYFGIPFAFLVCMKRRYFAKTIILTFLLITTAGSIYLFLGLSLLSYVLMKFSNKRILAGVVICSVAVYFYFLVIYIPPLEPSISNSNIVYGEVMSSSANYTSEVYLQQRSVSSVIRLGTISWSLQAALDHPFGMPETLNAVNGLLIYSFVTAGIIGFIFSLLFFRHMLNRIYSFFIIMKHNVRMQTAAALLAGLCIEAFMFNDYGYTTVHGMPLLALVLKKISSTPDAQNS
jgi:hypothetical protein